MKKNIIILKFAQAFGGGERYTLDILAKALDGGFKAHLFSNYSPLIEEANILGAKTKKIYWGQEAGSRRYAFLFLIFYFFYFVRFYFILKKIWQKSNTTVILQGLNEKILLSHIAKKNGCKVIWVEHLDPVPWLSKNMLLPLYLKSAKSVDRIVCVSSFVKNQLAMIDQKLTDQLIIIYKGIDPKKIFITNDDEKNSLKKANGIDVQEKIVVSVGRLHKEKGFDVLIKSIANSYHIKSLYLLIVGDGPEYSNLKKLAEKMGVQDRVVFAGYEKDINGLLNIADIFVLPSVARESFGIAIAEAMALGKIIVASRLGGIPELIDNGENGFLFCPGDDKELTAILDKILKDFDKYHTLGFAARKKYLSFFSIDVMRKKWEELL
ncbi:glycosyltransferase family 4 protein [Candidatus Microgenomates bacterium]|nr:glycosyltransferase family 4 protein [Candidatus Microgenomates bacterium]